MSSHSVREICARLSSHPESLSAFTSGRSYMSLLPLLEHPLPEVESQLKASLIEAGMSEEEIESVSLEKLVSFALTSWGQHWPASAISWLEAGFPINEELARRLEITSQEESQSQAIRHRAFALAKRWRRTQESPEAK